MLRPRPSLVSLIGVAVFASCNAWAKPNIFDFYEYARKQQGALAAPHEHPWVLSEIRRIDFSKRQITVTHTPAPSTGMARMTMTLAVADNVHLSTLRVGDRVDVQLDGHDNRVVVIGIRIQNQ